MKVLLYFEGEKALRKSGIGRALVHQQKALRLQGVDVTTDPTCTDYDILHINTYGPRSKQMIRRARKMGKKVVYHAHSTEEDFRHSFIGSNQLAPLLKRHLVNLYQRADYLITPTPYAKSLLENYGLTLPIQAISNGVELTKYAAQASKEAAFREYFQVKETEKVIICVGLYFERKGIVDFIALAKKFPEYRFIWFGHTPLYLIPARVRQLIVSDHPANVEFPGYINGDVLEGAYTASDLFFFPSYEETEGIVVLEALASRQQVLVRDIPVYEEWLTTGLNCYKGSTPAEFASLIEGILTDGLPSTRTKGYEVAAARSLTETGRALVAVYEDVLATEKNEEPLPVYW